MELIKHEKAKFEKNNLIISDSITIDEWKKLGTALKQVEGCVQFWIGDWARFGDKKGFTGKYTDPKVYDELQEITGLSRQTIKEYKMVSEKTSFARANDLGYAHHREVAKLPPERQSQFLKKASDEKLSVRDLRQAIRVDGNTSEKPEFKKDKKFRVVYADPPWSYGNQMPKGTTTPSDYYNTMTLDDICSLPVKNITEQNAVLFLWTTSPHLRESFDVIDAWGFKYKSSFIWDKIKHNMGHYNSVRHELLLICTKGSCTPDVQKLFDSVQSIERTEHSAKPEYFREIIDTIYPNGKRIELFARKKTEGWEVFGNES